MPDVPDPPNESDPYVWWVDFPALPPPVPLFIVDANPAFGDDHQPSLLPVPPLPPSAGIYSYVSSLFKDK